MPKKTAKVPKFNKDPLAELSKKTKEIKPQKDTKPIIETNGYYIDKNSEFVSIPGSNKNRTIYVLNTIYLK